MVSRIVTITLLCLLVIIHAQLWMGVGSVDHVQDLRAQIAVQSALNHQAQQANQRLAFEVEDLKEGKDMVQEKARSELGMVRPHEMFVQIVP